MARVNDWQHGEWQESYKKVDVSKDKSVRSAFTLKKLTFVTLPIAYSSISALTTLNVYPMKVQTVREHR